MAKIKCIAQSQKPTDPAIIFFHGLDGHGSKTWMTNSSDEETLWPKWLADDFKCSVYLVSYDAALSGWIDSAMPLPDQADAILEMLSSEPTLKNRPLILVGHSMGGLVIKTAIHHGLTKGVERYKKIVEQIRGVVFVGTPHNGSQLATLVTYASALIRTNPQVKNMQQHDAHLRTLNQQFRAYCNEPPAGKVSVLSFAETQGVFIGKKFLYLRWGPTLTIVDPNSSEPHVQGEIAVRLPEDHISMCKLNDKEEDLYKSLLRYLNDIDLTPPESLSKESPVAKENETKPKPSVSTESIIADNGSVAAAKISGSVIINNNK